MSDEAEERQRLIHNERVKLTATYLNGAALAIFATGGLAFMLLVFGPLIDHVLLVTLNALGATATSIFLHRIAQDTLGKLR